MRAFFSLCVNSGKNVNKYLMIKKGNIIQFKLKSTLKKTKSLHCFVRTPFRRDGSVFSYLLWKKSQQHLNTTLSSVCVYISIFCVWNNNFYFVRSLVVDFLIFRFCISTSVFSSHAVIFLRTLQILSVAYDCYVFTQVRCCFFLLLFIRSLVRSFLPLFCCRYTSVVQLFCRRRSKNSEYFNFNILFKYIAKIF